MLNDEDALPLEYSDFHKKEVDFPKKTFTFYSKTMYNEMVKNIEWK